MARFIDEGKNLYPESLWSQFKISLGQWMKSALERPEPASFARVHAHQNTIQSQIQLQ